MAPTPAAAKRKRPVAVKIEVGGGTSAASRPAAKRVKVVVPDPASSSSNRAAAAASDNNEDTAELKKRFLAMFAEPNFITGISNTALKTRFGDDYVRLAPIIQDFLNTSRLSMSRGAKNELIYTLISEDLASKFSGLDVSARLVYQCIEKAGNMGIWTVDIKKETKILDLNKIFKALESRRLIKQVKSISNQTKKLYMLYDLSPSKELTGGIWYSEMEFDHGFITELRTFLMHCVRKLNQGMGVTLNEILDTMNQAKISRVNLGLNDVGQLMQTLVYDYAVEEIHREDTTTGEDLTYYVAARSVSIMCNFKMWPDVLANDFHFRTVKFEDGVQLAPLEPHFQS